MDPHVSKQLPPSLWAAFAVLHPLTVGERIDQDLPILVAFNGTTDLLHLIR